MNSFEFWDHRASFHRGKLRVYNHPGSDEGPFTPDIAVGETDVALKDTMVFTYDYGDDWKFEVRLEQIEAKPCRSKRVKVMASAGKAPEQYPDFE
jgi:hypothetical protein